MHNFTRRVVFEVVLIGALSAVHAAPAIAQVKPAPPPPESAYDSVTVVPGARYDASAFYGAFAGNGYRRLWSTAVRVPVADMSVYGGGLTPMRVGGGTTTETLHLRGADGRRYVFRSVDKTLRELTAQLDGSPAEAVVQDQVSSFHPSAAPIVARLLDAVGVLHTTPTYVVVPDDPRLGEFRERFAGMLVLFEERPADLPRGAAGFAGSKRIVQTGELFDELVKNPKNRVDQRELLAARLIDLLVGDRDRSTNNHLWARFEDSIGFRWRPIPRDRDQSFIRFDGAVKTVARAFDFRLVAFDKDYSNTESVTRNAWDIDRRLLVGMDRAQWDSTVAEVVEALTDETIRSAVAQMPREHYALVGAQLESALRRRRAGLSRIANEFYAVVFRYADVGASDGPDVALVEGLTDGRVRIALNRRGVSLDTMGPSYYDRTFTPGETREIRLYLHGGDDRTVVRGTPGSPITVRIIGGDGADDIARDAGPEIAFYDAGAQTRVEGTGIDHARRSPSRPYSWFEKSYDLDWGRRTLPRPGVSYDADRGFVPIVGFETTFYGFGKQPYASRLAFRGGWAFAHSAPIIESSLRVQRLFSGADAVFDARYSGLDVVNYFGEGNENVATEPSRFYKVRQRQLELGISVAMGEGTPWEVSAGPTFKRVVTDTTDNNLLAQLRPFGTQPLSMIGLELNVAWDGTDLAAAPSRGVRFENTVEVYPGAGDLDKPFGSARIEVAAFASPPKRNPTLAVHVGAKKVWGKYPYFESAFLGGTQSVRGLKNERYAGDATVFGGAELRAFVKRVALFVPVDLGVFGFAATGRAFSKGESSSLWHSGHGVGIWAAPINRSATIQSAVASSMGSRTWYSGLGFTY